nr:hypothetical protein [Tanacetum cinerariifolium]
MRYPPLTARLVAEEAPGCEQPGAFFMSGAVCILKHGGILPLAGRACSRPPVPCRRVVSSPRHRRSYRCAFRPGSAGSLPPNRKRGRPRYALRAALA